MKLSERYLNDLAIQSLNLAADGVRENTCDVVSNEFGYTLEERHGTSVETVKAPVQGAKHFVAAIDSSEVSGFPEGGFVLVDATIRQFNDRFDQDLPDVVILGPEDDWNQYYDTVKV